MKRVNRFLGTTIVLLATLLFANAGMAGMSPSMMGGFGWLGMLFMWKPMSLLILTLISLAMLLLTLMNETAKPSVSMRTCPHCGASLD